MNRITAKIKFIAYTFMLIATATTIKAQDAIYTARDSLFIETIMAKHPNANYNSRGERAIAIAKEFIGQTYAGETLDREPGEPLYINTTELDCTTYMELVTAMATCKDNDNSFYTLCRNIEKLRYRNGIRNGYASRLHYISWWIEDSTKQNVIDEIYTKAHTAEQHIELNFMSRHPNSYPRLNDNPLLTEHIIRYEKEFGRRTVLYIPKERIKELSKEDVKDGDIIAIVTAIEGLDVSHIGFACWRNGELHMIHASSSKKSVIYDESTLHDYLARNRMHLGIRLIRLI